MTKCDCAKRDQFTPHIYGYYQYNKYIDTKGLYIVFVGSMDLFSNLYSAITGNTWVNVLHIEFRIIVAQSDTPDPKTIHRNQSTGCCR